MMPRDFQEVACPDCGEYVVFRKEHVLIKIPPLLLPTCWLCGLDNSFYFSEPYVKWRLGKNSFGVGMQQHKMLQKYLLND